MIILQLKNEISSKGRYFMRRDTIVYFGIIQFEYNNAMCQHARGIVKMIEGIGYRPVLIGVSSNVNRDTYKKIDNSRYVINDPRNLKERLIECISSNELKKILQEIGTERVKTFIMADFRFIPMKLMKKFCERAGILFAIDIMDRFESEKSIASKIKKIDCDLRMKYFYPKVERRIYICRYYNELLGKGDHIAVIPGVCENRKIKQQTYRDDIIRLVFLGRPGEKCEKEKIDWVIQAIDELNLSDKIELSLAGFEKNNFINNNYNLTSYIHNNITFYGRITQDKCFALLEKADFSIIVRPDTILSKYGFSTKIGEAFSCSVPVLATDTSDNKIYIEDGENGFICACNYESVKKMILRVSRLSRNEINIIKNNCRLNNPLHYSIFLQKFMRVVISE